MTRPVQYFSDEYQERCKKLTTADIVRFLEEFRLLHGGANLDDSRVQPAQAVNRKTRKPREL